LALLGGNPYSHKRRFREFASEIHHGAGVWKAADNLLEAVRLAPSARNALEWFFTGDEHLIHAYYRKPSFIVGL
jgi:hypothetical protein